MCRRFILLIVILVLNKFSSIAQVYDKKIIEAGHTLSEYNFYLFAKFDTANVKLKDGRHTFIKMNFNLLLCKMEFISPVGDTLSVSKPEDIDTIYLHNNLFFYNKIWVQILGGSDSVNIAILRNISYDAVKIGAMGLASHANGIQSYTSLDDGSGLRQLVMNEDVDITKETTYYLLHNNVEMIKATKLNFFKLFPKDKQRIETYLKSQKINYNKEMDLQKLLFFILHQPTQA